MKQRTTIVGVPKEIKVEEYRVGLTPASVRELTALGHTVLVEHNAGAGINFTDAVYQAAGASIVANADEVYAQADLIVKVKEPQPQEYALIRADQVIFTYLHLAAEPQLADALLASGSIAIAYETVTADDGSLPLLAPMSQVAGRLSVQVGAHSLEKSMGGSGILLGGVPGVAAGQVLVLGGGVVGTNAIKMALGEEARVTVVDKSLKRLQELDMLFAGKLSTVYASTATIEEAVQQADLVIGAVLVPGKSAPRLITRNMLKSMKPGSVMVDVAIDQGGCFETSKPTTHKNPVYSVDGIVHYCVTNMPGAVPCTSALALNNATLPYVLQLANHGWQQALQNNTHLRQGLNICQGQVVHPDVAVDLDKAYQPVNW